MSIEVEAARRLRQKKVEIATLAVQLQYDREPEVWARYGETGRDYAIRDGIYHLDYLAEALSASEPSLFVEYALWAKVLFAGLRLPAGALETSLQCTSEALRSHLDEALCDPACAIVEQALQQLPTAPSASTSLLSADLPCYELSSCYLEALLQGDHRRASKLVLDAVDAGVPLRDIYLDVFQRTQREIGRLWQTSQISVAQEHFCTAATQVVMAQLAPRVFATPRVGRSLVACCIGGELHEVGMRIVADMFELEGWDTYYVGANAPAFTVLDTVAKRKPDLLAISATMTFHVSAVTGLIDKLRASKQSRTPVLVGGYPFNLAPSLWTKIGADGYAHDGSAAVATARGLVS